MRNASPAASAVESVHTEGEILVCRMGEAVVLSDVFALLEEHAERVGDARGVVLSFERGGFERVARELEGLGDAARSRIVRRLVPVAWVISPRASLEASRQALRFAAWGYLRGLFYECESASAWIAQESRARRRGIP